jgi:hypothetical protein
MRRQTFGQQADPGDTDEGFAGGGAALVVVAQAAVAGQPGDGALDDPAPRQDHKALGPFRLAHIFQDPTTVLLDPDYDGFVAPIGPDQLQAASAICGHPS